MENMKANSEIKYSELFLIKFDWHLMIWYQIFENFSCKKKSKYLIKD